MSETSSPPAAEATPEAPDDSGLEAYSDEPYAAWSLFDHPSISRAARNTFAEKRLGRAIFINVLVLMVVFVIVQQLFTRGRLAFQSEEVSFARTAFLAFAIVETGLISLFLPMSFFGVFYQERKEQCFDQVVATGISPLRLLSGRMAIAMTFFGIMLLSALPFFILTVVMNGTTLGMVFSYYVVMFFYMSAISSITMFSVVAMDDTAIPVLYGLLFPGGCLVAGMSSRITPAFSAISPIRHVTIEMGGLMKSLGLGTFVEPTLFGVGMPCEIVSILIYLSVMVFALGYVLVGPDLELAPGLNSFDTVAVGRKGEVIRGQRLLTSTLLRTLQIRFFYENISPKLKFWSPFIRVFSAILFVIVADTWFLGGIWPTKNPTAFGGPEKRFLYMFMAFLGFNFLLLAILGTQARSALRDRRPVLKLGSFSLRRFPALFMVFLTGLSYPLALFLFSGWATDYPMKLLPDSTLTLFSLLVLYACFTFSLATLCAFVTTNPFSASGRALLTLTALNILPFIWVIVFYFNGVGESVSWILDFSPFLAAYAALKPNKKVPFDTTRDQETYRFEHDPSIWPFSILFSVLAVICLISALYLARKLYTQWKADDLEAKKERENILKGRLSAVGAIVLALIFPLQAYAQETPSKKGAETKKEEEEQPFEVQFQEGFNDYVSREGFVPFSLSITNNGEAVKALVQLEQASGAPIVEFYKSLQPGARSTFETLIPSYKLASSPILLKISREDGEFLWSKELEIPGPSVKPIVLIIDQFKSKLDSITPSLAFKSRSKLTGLRLKGKKKRAWRATSITAKDAPTSALTYSGIQSVILGDITESLDKRQAIALTDWAARGGSLVVCVADRGKSLRQSPLGEILNKDAFRCISKAEPRRDVALTKLAQVYAAEFDSRAPAVAVLNRSNPDATILLEDQGQPLILEQAYGAGRITILAFDLWQGPLQKWGGKSRLVSELLSSPPHRVTRSTMLFPALTTIQTSQAKIAPAFTALLLYAFIAGPVVYFVLKPKKKGLLAWFIIPAIILVFSLMTPLYSLVLKESDSAYYGVTVIESFPGTNKAMVTSDMLVFSGGKESHDITVQRENAQAYTVVPRRQRRETTPLGEKAYVGMNESNHLRINPLKLAMWGTRYLSIESAEENPLKISGRIRLVDKNKYQLELNNNGNYKLEDLFIVFPCAEAGSIDLGFAEADPIDVGESYSGGGIVARGLEGPDTKNQYALVVKELLAKHYRVRVEEERTAWVFAKLTEKIYGGGIRTDQNLTLSSWTAVGIAPIDMYYDQVPYGAAKLNWTDKVARVETTKNGESNVHEGLYEFTFTKSTLRDTDKVKSLRFQFSSRDKLEFIKLDIWEAATKSWRRLKLNEMEELIAPPKKGEDTPQNIQSGERSFHEFELKDVAKILPPKTRRVLFRYTYYRETSSRRGKKDIGLNLSLKLESQ